jgi:two-component system sensor histidine kinase/response regulator
MTAFLEHTVLQPASSSILIVDDNPANLGILVEAFSKAGFQVRVAQDGESAIAQTLYAPPNLILLDVMMPGWSGFETCQYLKANPDTQAIPIIFMTALSDVVDKVQGFQVGGVDYITKPFELEEVLVRVRTHLTVQMLQQQLHQQNEKLQAEICDRIKTEEALRVFLHAVSHDLRNPVVGGLMVLQSLLEEAKTAGGHAQLSQATLQRMIQSWERQLSLINSLLETHQNEIYGVSLALQPVQVPSLVDQLLAEWELRLHRDDAHVHNQIPTDLPPIQGDAHQIWRVFENLFANALRHNPPGLTLTLMAEVLTTEQPPKIRCTIHDDGVGIVPEQQATLFDRYQQGTLARRSVGLGLGLYLCRQIVLAHGGDIGVDSKPGEGTLFWFTLPVAS